MCGAGEGLSCLLVVKKNLAQKAPNKSVSGFKLCKGCSWNKNVLGQIGSCLASEQESPLNRPQCCWCFRCLSFSRWGFFQLRHSPDRIWCTLRMAVRDGSSGSLFQCQFSYKRPSDIGQGASRAVRATNYTLRSRTRISRTNSPNSASSCWTASTPTLPGSTGPS